MVAMETEEVCHEDKECRSRISVVQKCEKVQNWQQAESQGCHGHLDSIWILESKKKKHF